MLLARADERPPDAPLRDRPTVCCPTSVSGHLRAAESCTLFGSCPSLTPAMPAMPAHLPAFRLLFADPHTFTFLPFQLGSSHMGLGQSHLL